MHYDKFSGKRRRYKSPYEASEPNKLWYTTSEKFFIITYNRKAAYCELGDPIMGRRTAFRACTLTKKGDEIYNIQPVESVPDLSTIDIERYSKGRTVDIGQDVLWASARTQKAGKGSTGNTVNAASAGKGNADTEDEEIDI